MWQIFCFEIRQYFTSGLQAFSFQSCQICFHQVTQKKRPELDTDDRLNSKHKTKPTTTKRSAKTKKKKRKLPWKKLKWNFQVWFDRRSDDVWLLIRKRWQVKWWKQCSSGHVSNLAHMLQHTFQSGRKMKKKNQQICVVVGVCAS